MRVGISLYPGNCTCFLVWSDYFLDNCGSLIFSKNLGTWNFPVLLPDNFVHLMQFSPHFIAFFLGFVSWGFAVCSIISCADKSYFHWNSKWAAFLWNERMRWLTALVGQTDSSSSLVGMWAGRLCCCWAQVHHADLRHLLRRGDEELRHVNWDAYLSHAVIHTGIMRSEPEAGRKRKKNKARSVEWRWHVMDLCYMQSRHTAAAPGMLLFS